jgi:hypothetical protein
MRSAAFHNPHDRVFLDLLRHSHFLHDPLTASEAEGSPCAPRLRGGKGFPRSQAAVFRLAVRRASTRVTV